MASRPSVFKPAALGDKTAKAAVRKAVIEGHTIGEQFDAMAAQTQKKFVSTVTNSIQSGDNLRKMAARISGGIVDGESIPGFMQITRSQSQALVHTSVTAVSKQDRLEAFRANAGVIRAVKQVSTLDNRTTDICISYSDLEWNVETLEPIGHSKPWAGGPPRHFNCRSVIVPVVKSPEELGVKVHASIPPAVRATMDGIAPQSMSFTEFLQGKSNAFQDQVLGKAKASLFRKGKLDLKDLVNFNSAPPLDVAALDVRKAASRVAAQVATPDPFKDLGVLNPSIPLPGAVRVKIPFAGDTVVAKVLKDADRIKDWRFAIPEFWPARTVKLDKLIAAQPFVLDKRVKEYAQLIQDGARFPEPLVILSEGKYYVKDGHHRLEALRLLGKENVRVRFIDPSKMADYTTYLRGEFAATSDDAIEKALVKYVPRDDKLAVDEWQSVFGNVDPAAVVRGMGVDVMEGALGEPNVIKIFGQRNQIYITADWANGTRIVREFNKADGDFVVKHSFLKIVSEKQGIGKQILGDAMSMYKSLGVKTVKLSAGLETGGYAWGRYGFLPEPNSWNELRRELKDKLAVIQRQLRLQGKSLPDGLVDDIKSSLNKGNPESLWDIADISYNIDSQLLGRSDSDMLNPALFRDRPAYSLGQVLLRGTEWYGKFDFNNQSQNIRLFHYVNP